MSHEIICMRHTDASFEDRIQCPDCFETFECKEHDPIPYAKHEAAFLNTGYNSNTRASDAARKACIPCIKAYLKDFDRPDLSKKRLDWLKDFVMECVVYGNTDRMQENMRCLRFLYRLGWKSQCYVFEFAGLKFSAKQVRELLRHGCGASVSYVENIIRYKKWDHIKMVAKYRDDPECQRLVALYDVLAVRNLPDELINMTVNNLIDFSSYSLKVQ